MFLCKALHWLLLAVGCIAHEYVVDNSDGHGRRFDGVGAVSGGGVSQVKSMMIIGSRLKSLFFRLLLKTILIE